MRDYRDRIAENLEYHRKQNNVSQSKLSKMCGLHRSYVGKIERGKKTPSLDTLQKISDALFLPMAALFDRSVTEDTGPETEAGSGKRLYRHVFENASCPMAVVRSDGTIVRANPSFQTFHDVPRDRIIGQPIWEMETSPLRDHLKQIFPPPDGVRFDRTAVSGRRGPSPNSNSNTEALCMISRLALSGDQPSRFLLEFPTRCSEREYAMDHAMFDGTD